MKMYGHKHCHGHRCHRPPINPSHHTGCRKPIILNAPLIQPPIYQSYIPPHVQPPAYYEPPPAYDSQCTCTCSTASPPPSSCDNQVYDWVSSGAHCQVPPTAVEVGTDVDGSKIYVGRARYQNDQLPCKVIPRRGQAYVSYDGKEHEVNDYDVMVEKKLASIRSGSFFRGKATVRESRRPKLTWVRSGYGSVPEGAVAGGYTSCGETLYIGRVRHGGSLCLGKVHPSHGCLYIPYGGQEISYRDYEVLVIQ